MQAYAESEEYRLIQALLAHARAGRLDGIWFMNGKFYTRSGFQGWLWRIPWPDVYEMAEWPAQGVLRTGGKVKRGAGARLAALRFKHSVKREGRSGPSSSRFQKGKKGGSR